MQEESSKHKRERARKTNDETLPAKPTSTPEAMNRTATDTSNHSALFVPLDYL